MPAITDIKKKAADINPSTKTGITKGCHDPLPVKGVLGYWWVVGAMQRYCVPRTDLGQRVKQNKKTRFASVQKFKPLSISDI